MIFSQEEIDMRKYIFIVITLITLFCSRPLPANQGGKVISWGTQVAGVNMDRGFIAIAPGYAHTLGLIED